MSGSFQAPSLGDHTPRVVQERSGFGLDSVGRSPHEIETAREAMPEIGLNAQDGPSSVVRAARLL
jgi:hypothetical protein